MEKRRRRRRQKATFILVPRLVLYNTSHVLHSRLSVAWHHHITLHPNIHHQTFAPNVMIFTLKRSNRPNCYFFIDCTCKEGEISMGVFISEKFLAKGTMSVIPGFFLYLSDFLWFRGDDVSMLINSVPSTFFEPGLQHFYSLSRC